MTHPSTTTGLVPSHLPVLEEWEKLELSLPRYRKRCVFLLNFQNAFVITRCEHKSLNHNDNYKSTCRHVLSDWFLAVPSLLLPSRGCRWWCQVQVASTWHPEKARQLREHMWDTPDYPRSLDTTHGFSVALSHGTSSNCSTRRISRFLGTHIHPIYRCFGWHFPESPEWVPPAANDPIDAPLDLSWTLSFVVTGHIKSSTSKKNQRSRFVQ